MQFALRSSSSDRFWTGFSATIYDTSGGFTETSILCKHNISMHVGPPIVARCRCDGVVQRRLQVRGDIDVIPVGFSGAWQDDGPTSMLIVSVTPALVQTAAEGMGIDPDRVSIVPQLHVRDPQIEHVLWALMAELESKEPLGRLYAESLGLALAAQLLRRYAPVVPRRDQNGLAKRRLARVMEYIHDHLTRDLSLTELAAIANVSPSHFKSLFKQTVGIPVHQYVIERRVERATDLLLIGKLRPSEVALQAGFANQSHMARCMRRVTGLTPTALLRKCL